MTTRIKNRPKRGAARSRILAIVFCAVAALTHSEIARAEGIEYPTQSHDKMTKPLPFKAGQAEIDQLDADTRALVDQLKAGSPTAVEYSERAHGVLIFPRIETSNYFLLGETKALGVLYVKNDTGSYEKANYYFGERNALGFVTGAQTSSRVFMFMKEAALDEFLAGKIPASFMIVDPETGDVSGEPNADVAVFQGNVEGDVGGVGLQGLKIVPVAFIE